MTEKNPKYKEAIKKTLIYSSIFRYPLTYYQLLNFLIIEPQEKINIKSFEYELAKLIKKQYVVVEHEKCILPGTKYIEWQDAKKYAKTLIKKNRPTFKILKKIPWIKFIGITGSGAAYNSDAESDLDILVITQKNRIWITRGIMAFILKVILGNYVKKGVDPNIFITDTSMEWPKEQQNLYVANEIVRMHPIYDKDNTYFKFLHSNKWIENYLGNFKTHYIENTLENQQKYQGEVLLNLIDYLFMLLQKTYMRKKVTSEIVKKQFIHFNKNDSSNPILDKYQEKTSTL